MKDLSEDDLRRIFGEELGAQLKAVIENMPNGAEVNRRFDQLDARLAKIEDNASIIKAVVTDHSRQLQDHEERILDLEQAA